MKLGIFVTIANYHINSMLLIIVQPVGVGLMIKEVKPDIYDSASNYYHDDVYDSGNTYYDLCQNCYRELKRVNQEEQELQNDDAIIIKPGFLHKWWLLRQHIVKYELPYYYEMTDPIITLEVVWTVVMSLLFILQLFILYEGDFIEFITAVYSDNIRCILFEFTVMILISTLWTLKCILKPYEERKEHINYLDDEIVKLKFNLWTCSKVKDNQQKEEECKKTIDLCEFLKDKIKQETLAPKVLGIELNETRLLAIQSYIGGVFATYIVVVWSSIKSYNE
eukprot:47894_1